MSLEEVAARMVGVARRQRAQLAEEKAKRADAGAEPAAGNEKKTKKKKKKGMFSRMF